MAGRNLCPIFLFCIMSCLAQLGWGLQCYKCSSIYYEDCDHLRDPSKTEVMTCPPSDRQQFYCMKVAFQFQNKQVVQRGCSLTDDCNLELESLKPIYSIDALDSCDVCSGKLCNSATSVEVTVTLIFAGLTSAYMIL